MNRPAILASLAYLSIPIVLSIPSTLTACPMCNAGSTDLTLKLIGAFLLFPFLVFSGVVLVYRIISGKETTKR